MLKKHDFSATFCTCLRLKMSDLYIRIPPRGWHEKKPRGWHEKKVQKSLDTGEAISDTESGDMIMAQPNAQNEIKQAPLQKSLLNLDTFEDVTLVKEVPPFRPVANMHEAAARLNNDSAALVAAINEGLRIKERERVATDENIPWQVLTDDGDVAGEFNGTPADPKKVNALILNLAKTIFGYSKDLSAEAKGEAKDKAKDLIRNTPTILEPLKKSAAAVETE